MLSSVGKKSEVNILKYFFFFFFAEKKALTFPADCLLVQAHFLGKDKKNIINLSFAKYAQRVVKVNH